MNPEEAMAALERLRADDAEMTEGHSLTMYRSDVKALIPWIDHLVQTVALGLDASLSYFKERDLLKSRIEELETEAKRIDAALLIGWRAGARAQRRAEAGEHVKAHSSDFEQMHAALRKGEHHE